MALQIRRGPNAQRATTLLQTGEISWTTDTKKLYVGDGVTTGGVNILANIAGTGFVWNPSTEQLDLAGSTITGINADNVSETTGIVPRLWYRSSLGKTHASEIFTTVAGAAHSGISFSWDDVNQKLTATVLTENAADAAAALFTAGTHTGIGFTYGLTQDAANRIDAAVDPEFIQDTVNDLFTAGVHTGITFTYSDSLNAMSAAVSYPLAGGNLGSNLVLSTYNITGTGNINISGTITSSGAISSSASVSAPTVSSNNYFTSNDIGFNIFTTVGNDLSIRSSRGTELVKESVQAGDAVGSFTTRGWVQSKNDFVLASGIASQLDATANLTTDFPRTNMGFVVGNNSSGPTGFTATLRYDGNFKTASFTSTGYAGSGSYPSGPDEGTIIFDTTTKRFMGYTGAVGGWKALDN